MAGRSVAFLSPKPIAAPLILGTPSGEFLSYFKLDGIEDIWAAELRDLEVNIKTGVDSGNGDIRVELGVVYDELGYLEDAEKELKNAVYQLPKNAQAKYALARLLMNQRLANDQAAGIAKKEWSLIVTHLRDSIEIDKNNIPAHYYLGNSIERLVDDGTYGEAINAYKLYIKHNAPLGFVAEVNAFIDNRDPVKQKAAALLAGESAFQAGEYTESAEAFLQAAKLGATQAFYRLGQAYEAAGTYAKAVDAYLAVIVYGATEEAHQAILDLGRVTVNLYTSLAPLQQAINGLDHLLVRPDLPSPLDYQKKRLIEHTKMLSEQILQTIEAIRPHDSKVTALVFSPNGEFIISGSEKGTIKRWSSANGMLISTLRTGGAGSVEKIIYAPDGETFAVLTQQKTATSISASIQVFSEKASLLIHTLDEGKNATEILDLVYLPQHNHLGLATYTKTNAICLWKTWDFSKNEIVQTTPLDDSILPRVTIFSLWGDQLLTLSNSGMITVWKKDKKEQMTSTTFASYKKGLDSIVFSRDGSSILGASNDGSVQSHNLRSTDDFQEVLKQQYSIQELIFSPDGENILITIKGNTPNLWSIKKPTKLQMYLTDHNKVESMAFSPDNKLLALGLENASIVLFEVMTGEKVHRLPFEGFPAWTPLATER
jgi:WD40 repeat protein